MGLHVAEAACTVAITLVGARGDLVALGAVADAVFAAGFGVGDHLGVLLAVLGIKARGPDVRFAARLVFDGGVELFVGEDGRVEAPGGQAQRGGGEGHGLQRDGGPVDVEAVGVDGVLDAFGAQDGLVGLVDLFGGLGITPAVGMVLHHLGFPGLFQVSGGR